MPYISTEALLGAGLLVVLALAYQYIPKAEAPSGNSKKRKNKKKGGNKDSHATAGGQGADDIKASTAGGKDGRGKKDLSNGQANGAPAVVPKPLPTKEENVPKESAPTSFAAAAAAKPKQKTLAEKLAPKEPRTKVDDMLAPEDRPGGYARVMSIKDASSSSTSPSTSLAPPAPASVSSATSSDQKVSKFENDYAESSSSEEEEDGWDVVASKKKKPISISIGGGGGSAKQPPGSTALPLPTETKIQRKNAKKAEAKKAARAAEEEERQRRLAMHKRDLEKERINDIYGKKKGSTPSTGAGAGSKATLNANGKLIWD